MIVKAFDKKNVINDNKLKGEGDITKLITK